MWNVSSGIISAPCRCVDVASQPVDVQLRQIANERDAAAHVAVERGVAERDLGFVAARNQQRAGVVRLGHHQQAADARVQVFAREVLRDRMRVRLEHLAHVLVDVLDGNYAVADPERARQPLGDRPGASRC